MVSAVVSVLIEHTRLQTQIPEGGNLLALILYADKTRLSSFGTVQGYPVVAHCANLPASI
jgi:hypothetical protein